MKRSSFFKSLITLVVAPKIISEIEWTSEVIDPTVSSLPLSRFLLGDIVIGIDGIKYMITSYWVGSHSPLEYKARPLSMHDNCGEAISINETNHSQFTQVARQLVA